MKFDLRKYVLLIMIVLSSLFFYKIFTGYAIQGNKWVSDSSLGFIMDYSKGVGHTTGVWSDDIWMGFNDGHYQINLYTLYSKILPIGLVLGASYLSSLLISFIFGYLFLKKLKLDVLPSLFGSVAYAFSPVVLSYIYAGHTQAVCSLGYVPMIFYFLTAAFDTGEKSKIKIGIFLFLAGAFLGLFLEDEIQRGVYFTLLAAAFAAFKIFTRNIGEWKNFKKSNFGGIGIDVLKGLTIFIVIGLAFYNGSSFLIEKLNERMSLQKSSLTAETEKSSSWDFAVSYSFYPVELIDSLAFGFHGKSSLETTDYYWGEKDFSSSSDNFGLIVLLFSILGSIAYFKKSGTVKFFLAGGILALLLSFGKYWPGVPFFWVFYHLPFMANFRAPVKLLCVTAFCFSVLSGYGMKFLIELVSQKNERLNKIRLERTLIALLSAGILALFIMLIFSNDIMLGFNLKYNDPGRSAAIVNNIIRSLFRMDIFLALLLAVAAIAFRATKFPGKNLLLPAAFVLLIADLWSIDLFYVDRSYIRLDEFYKPDGIISYLQKEEKEPFRIITSLMVPSTQENVANIWLTSLRRQYLTFYFSYFDLQPMEVIASSGITESYQNFFTKSLLRGMSKPVKTPDDLLNMNLPLLRLSGVKYLITDGYLYAGREPVVMINGLTNNTNLTLAAVETGYGGQQEAVFEVKNCHPFLAFFENYVPAVSDQDALRYLGDPGFDPDRKVVINAPVTNSGSGKRMFAPQKILDYKTWYIKSDINTGADGLILFNMMFDPGWKAFVDGAMTKIYRADYLEMGIFVGRGSHTVEFKFQPDPLPFLISFFTALAGIACGILYYIYSLIFVKKN